MKMPLSRVAQTRHPTGVQDAVSYLFRTERRAVMSPCRRRVRVPPPRNNFIAAPSRNLGGAAHKMDLKEDKRI